MVHVLLHNYICSIKSSIYLYLFTFSHYIFPNPPNFFFTNILEILGVNLQLKIVPKAEGAKHDSPSFASNLNYRLQKKYIS